VLRERLKTEISNSQPFGLLVDNDDYYQIYVIDYHGGKKYPKLASARERQG
jgi:hypothetical protein